MTPGEHAEAAQRELFAATGTNWVAGPECRDILEAAIRAAVDDEREACAEVADEFEYERVDGRAIARRIRARAE